jgi:putative cell wall-binding protein
LLAGALALSGPAPALAAGALDNHFFPGFPASHYFTDSLQDGVDDHDFFAVYLLTGQRISVTMTGDPGTNFDLYLMEPTATDWTGPYAESKSSPAQIESFTYTATATGWFPLVVATGSPTGGQGTYALFTAIDWPSSQPPDTPERVSGSDRHSTACQVARKAYPNYGKVTHVILASGEDRAAADPLAASGLAWTYGGPLLLTHGDFVPSCVISELQSIVAASGSVTIHVVGGPASIPEARLTEIKNSVAGVTTERVTPNGDRFTLAASIARRMAYERLGQNVHGGSGGVALIANGADPEKFFDALALSAVCANTGSPILLVAEDSIPGPTAAALADLGLSHRIIGGGPATVSDGVEAQLGAGGPTTDRWWGSDRYETARTIAIQAQGFSPQYSIPANTAVAAEIPDALTGGTFIGLRGGSILVAGPDSLPAATQQFLHNQSPKIGEVYVLGGEASVSSTTFNDVAQQLKP